MTLLFALTLVVAPTSLDPVCTVGDHACKAAQFDQAAARATDPALKAQRLYLAHRSYLFLYRKTGDPAALCNARARLDEGLAVRPRPTELDEPLRTSAAELRAREAAAKVDCTTRPRATSSKVLVARKATGPSALPTEHSAPVPETSSPTPTSRAPERLLLDAPEPPATPPGKLLPVASVRRSGPQPAPPSPPPERPRRPPARIAGGSLLLLAGAGLAAGMGVSLHQRAMVVGNFRDLAARLDAAGRDATSDEYALADAYNQRYGRLTLAAGITGAAAIASTVAGVVLLATPPRRSRMLALPWAGSRSAGVALHGRF